MLLEIQLRQIVKSSSRRDDAPERFKVDPDAAAPDRGAPMLAVLCALIICGILAAGLWPFHSPVNRVTWLSGENGVAIGYQGMLLTSGKIQPSRLGANDTWSAEIRLEPGNIVDRGRTILAFSTPENPLQFELKQDEGDVGLRSELQDAHGHAKVLETYIDHILQPGKRALVTIASAPQGTAVYVDGALIKSTNQFRLSANALSGQLVVGTSPVRSESWAGKLSGLAIYDRELTAAEVQRHYQMWTTSGGPYMGHDERSVALYVLDEHQGDMVHNHGDSAVDLHIPARYAILHKKFLEPVWKEFNLYSGFWKSAFINVVGFIPLGLFLSAYLSRTHPAKHVILWTILAGTIVSLTIELLQFYLPTRDSGTTDLITNTLGTSLGSATYLRWSSIFNEIISRLNPNASRCAVR